MHTLIQLIIRLIDEKMYDERKKKQTKQIDDGQ